MSPRTIQVSHEVEYMVRMNLGFEYGPNTAKYTEYPFRKFDSHVILKLEIVDIIIQITFFAKLWIQDWKVLGYDYMSWIKYLESALLY